MILLQPRALPPLHRLITNQATGALRYYSDNLKSPAYPHFLVRGKFGVLQDSEGYGRGPVDAGSPHHRLCSSRPC